MMKHLLLLLVLAAQISAQAISAALTLVQYEPFVFQLKFSEVVTKPAFQLLLNNLEALSYTFITTEEQADTFYFQISPASLPSTSDLQTYQLIFNSPLRVGSGRLGTNYFMLTADKVSVEIEYSQTLGLLAIISAYVMINFTPLGLTLIQFLQVYCLIMFSNEMKTQLYHEISKDLLLLNPHLEDNQLYTGSLEVIIFMPILLTFFFGFTGFVVRRFVARPDSITRQIIYENLVYNLFIISSSVLVVPLFFNSIQFYQLTKTEEISTSSLLGKLGSFTSYLGIITTFSIIYLFVYIINPKLGQTEESWKKYLTKQQYFSFRRTYQAMVEDIWYKRNKNILVIMKRLLVVALFFWEDGFEVSILLLEFADIFYIFTFRPFKQEMYTNIVVVSRLLMFLFYGVVVLGNLYYSVGSITMNYSSTKVFLQARDAVFLTIILIIFLFSFYDIYFKCSNLNYQIRLVKEQDEFKLEIVAKQQQAEDDSKRKHLKSFDQSESRSTHRKSYIKRPQQPNNEGNLLRVSDSKKSESPKKVRGGSMEKKRTWKKTRIFGEEDLMKSSLPAKTEVEMENMGRSRNVSSVNSENKSQAKREKNKWKKQSLLAAILKEK